MTRRSRFEQTRDVLAAAENSEKRIQDLIQETRLSPGTLKVILSQLIRCHLVAATPYTGKEKSSNTRETYKTTPKGRLFMDFIRTVEEMLSCAY